MSPATSQDAERFRREVDSLDTGLPPLPDLTAVHAAVRRRRRRLRATVVGAGALALGLGVSAALLPGGDDVRATDETSPAADPAPRVAPSERPPAPAVDPGELAGPWFGPRAEAAVARVLPGLELAAQRRGDHWLPLDETSSYDFAVSDPVRWETFFNWSLYYDDPASGVHVDVVASRQSPSPVQVTGNRGACRDGLYPVRAFCREITVGKRTVVLSDGIRFEKGGTWYRQVEVFGPAGVREMEAQVYVGAFGPARTRADADATLPSLADLRRLALDRDLVLPEPASYPDEFPE